MSGDRDRRAPGATRIPFEAMVEVGGSLGPSFEAQAVDVSGTGMHLRTAYLPDVGQPLTCRFDVGRGDGVLAAGEVMWTQEMGRGGEFGIRFTDLDAQSVGALRRIIGAAAAVSGVGDATADEGAIPRATGAKVRLHIDGLGSPMRARVKGENRSELMVGSELGFLQVGKELELEDADTGAKRAARIDRVEVEIDPESRVPQLVVALRYVDDDAACAEGEDATPRESTPGPSVMANDGDGDGEVDVDTAAEDDAAAEMERPTRLSAAPNAARVSAENDDDDDDIHAIRSAGDRMKGSLSRGAAKIAPAMNAFAQRARTTFALVAAKRFGGKKDDVAIPVRRVTAPPPTGGLHAAGRKVVRDSIPDADPPKSAMDRARALALVTKIGKKRVVLAGTVVGVAAVTMAIAFHKPHAASPPGAGPDENTGATAAAATGAPNEGAAPLATTAPAATTTAPSGPDLGGGAAGTGFATSAGGGMVTDGMPSVTGGADDGDRETSPSDRRGTHARKVVVPPFTNGGAIAHGNVLRIKMDGTIDRLQGASQTTGFTVVLPGRRSLEAAGPLAARDGRIASIKVTNDAGGAELSVTFKDGVPNYLVRARGDVLEIVLAQPGMVAAQLAATKGQTPEPPPREQHMMTAQKRKHTTHKR